MNLEMKKTRIFRDINQNHTVLFRIRRVNWLISQNQQIQGVWELFEIGSGMISMSEKLKKSGLAAAMFLTLAVAGCNSSTSAVETKKSASKQAETEKTETKDETSDAEATLAAEGTTEDAQQLELANVITKPGKVQKRGGYIKILVNKKPITNIDIQRRASFLKLRRVGGNRTKAAEKELIEQSIKLEEARVRNVLATDQQVDAAFANFAKQNRSTPAQLARELGRLGVGASHFKDFIRSQISWQRAVQGRFQAETSQVSERDVVTRLRKSGSTKPEVTEYNIQQIIFVVPQSKRNKTTLAARRTEAIAFRQRFTRCENSLEQAKALRDVSVVDRKRIMEPELPLRWKDDIINIDKRNITRVKETDKGIEIMAVCNKRVVTDDRAAQVTTQSAEFESFNEKGSELSQSYLDQLLTRSTIIYQ
ncbi:MAG: peptidylprolyl isomerase [Pseudomonadota bacterium]